MKNFAKKLKWVPINSGEGYKKVILRVFHPS